MEAATRIQESQRSPISPLNSPHSSNNNGVQIQTSRSDNNMNNPYPTTFVQADTSTFKQVVQMLTGSTTDTTTTSPKQQQDPPPRNYSIPPIKNSPKRQQQQQNNSFKLYERRNSNLKNTLIINTLLPNFGNNINSSPRNNNNNKTELLSPSLLDFPKLTLSPVTPLNEDTFNNSSPSIGNSSSSSEEERAIAEKGFYLHPSPISTPRDSEPQLLSLFPVTSPKVSGSSF